MTCLIQFRERDEVVELEIDIFKFREIAECQIGMVRLMGCLPLVNNFFNANTQL
jgi:hypothetical protein